MMEHMLSAIGKNFPMAELSCGEYAQMKVSGMKFSIRQFHAEGLGHVSAMVASGFFGLMKMDTLIFELYDTLLGNTDLSGLDAVKQQYQALPEHDLGSHWYDPIKLPQSLSKKGKKVHTTAFHAAAKNYMAAYLEAAKAASSCDADAKREKASVYVEGLLTNGGPSTDVFKKGIGDEKTAQLFRKVLFATEK